MKKSSEKSDRDMLYNRELSWLSFNERVLQEARDEKVPLLQRLRFLGIYSNNQDEFVKVRVANLERCTQVKATQNKKLSGGYVPEALLEEIHRQSLRSQLLFEETYAAVLSGMEKHGIFVRNEKQLDEAQERFCRAYFADEVSPLLVPLMLRKSTPLPFLRDGRIYLAVQMSSARNVRYAIIEIPPHDTLPRFVVLPSADATVSIVFVDDIIRLCLDEIFFMFDYDRIAAYTFKFMRDAELTLDDDVWKSLIQKMEQGLAKRRHGRPVRLVYDKEIPADMLETLARKLGLHNRENLSPGGRYHLLRDLMYFPKVAPELENRNPPPLRHPDAPPFTGFFGAIRQKDILLNYPYHTFNHLIDFLREAAVDPRVDSICITLYRTARKSKVINALINAAKNGKQVIVCMELMARFDEERNIENSGRLRAAGVQVVHGEEGLKVHAKLILVTRRENGSVRSYAHIGTGNFNEDTAKVYSDFSLFTCRPEIAEEVGQMFDFLVNRNRHAGYRKLLVSPDFMRSGFYDLIEREIRNARNEKKAYIHAKFNSLTDEGIIRMLYRASAAGVEIRLIVRGACCLKPGVPGLSENIRAISIVDKYLEHARLAIFCNGGNEKAYIGSADWMKRNLDRRVEVAAPVLDEDIRRTLKRFFDIQWNDTDKARDLSLFRENVYIGDEENIPENERRRSQTELYDFWASGE